MPRLRIERLAAIVSLLLLTASAIAEERTPDPARVEAWTQMLPAAPLGVGRPISDRQAWEAVGQAAGFRDVVARAEKLMPQPLPEASDELYLEFSRNGNRTRYQAVQGQRHSRFSLLALAECIENKGRFLPALEEAIRAVCSEKAWTMPAHDRDLRNFKGRVIDIDLNSAATSWNMATVCFWLGDKLSDATRKLICDELERRTLTPFENYVKTGAPKMWWPTCTNNWNAVCLADVTGTALAVIDSPERRAFFAASAEKYIEHFLSGFTSDGYCSEGIGYWNYGFGHYVMLAETLHQATGGKVDLLKDPRIEPIARFGLRMEILPGIYPAFADCHPGAKPTPELMAFLSRRYCWGLREIEEKSLLLAGGASTSLFQLGLMRFANSASAAPAAEPAASAQPPRDWFDQAGILICRPAPGNKRALGVAMKGGHNAEHHNHNDVGSFLVAIGGNTPLVDPGSEVYTRRTFSDERYTSGVLNSFGHPVPRVAGQLQKTGRNAEAKLLKTEFTDTTDTLVLDLRSAYPVEGLEELTRTFVFSRDGSGSLTVSDRVRFASPQKFGTALVTFSPWKPSGEKVLVVGEGEGSVRVEIATGGPSAEIHADQIQEELPDRRIPTRLGIDLAEPVQEATITLTIRGNE